MAKTLKEAYEETCTDIVIDKDLILDIEKYRFEYINNNEQHLLFYGGHLTGVHKVVFTDADTNKWFTEIIKQDEDVINKVVIKLPSTVTKFIRQSNVFNQSCIWLVHKIMTSKLNSKLKENGINDVLYILQYKFISSILNHYFKFNTTVDLAESTFSSLTYQFLIKRYGNWNKVFESRNESILMLHKNTFMKFETDKNVYYAIVNIQEAIRDMIKNIFAKHIKIVEQGKTVSTTSSVGNLGDGEKILDTVNDIDSSLQYMIKVLSDKKSFVKQDLIDIVCAIQDTSSPELVKKTLTFMSEKNNISSYKIKDIVKATVIHCYNYISNNRNVITNINDLQLILTKIRGVYMASKSSDSVIIELRVRIESLIKTATGYYNATDISSARTAIMLYISLRSLTKNYYS